MRAGLRLSAQVVQPFAAPGSRAATPPPQEAVAYLADQAFSDDETDYK